MEEKVIIKKHAKKYCTECLTSHKKYFVLKTLYERHGKSWIASDLFRCEYCGVVAQEDVEYVLSRLRNNHIIKKLSTVIE